ncbi:glycosyltransferase family 9 protein, partial [Candidatus Poribacteria bacterium]|nr:glycosyltransferase family 9 protein [Candidatus Poribacteria bacterium]
MTETCRAPGASTIERILCIRPDGLGDMVCALPTFAALRRAYPTAHLAVLASPLNAPIIEAGRNVSETIVYDRGRCDRGPRALCTLAWRLRRERYDAVVAMRTATYANVIAAASGASRRVGYAGKPGSRWLSTALPGGHVRGAEHEILRNARLAEALGATSADADPVIALTNEERAWAADWLAANGFDETTTAIGVHPGASTSDRCYPEDRYARAASELGRDRDDRPGRAIVFGGPHDAARVEAVIARLEGAAARADAMSLRRMMALMARVDVMLANDSGPMHIAAALGVPLVAVFGPGDHVRWMPRADAA